MNDLVKTTPAAVSAIDGMTRVEIDMQIATAKQYPRPAPAVLRDQMKSLATIDEETAVECTFSLPRGGKMIEGPSIRLAEIIAQYWPNVRVSTRVVEVGQAHLVAEGIFHDLENNVAQSVRVSRRITDKYNRRYNDDMIVMTGNAACSIARRNVILACVPKAVWRSAYEGARSMAMGEHEDMPTTITKAFDALLRFNVTEEQVLDKLAISGRDEITREMIPNIRGMFATLKNGEMTAEVMFGAETEERKSDPDYNPMKGSSKKAAKKPAPKKEAEAPKEDDGGIL